MDTKATGFTLLELLMAIAVAAIIMALAMPSFRYVTNSNRIAGEINGLLGDLQFARAEAIKEGRTVTACVSQDGASCSGATSWENGWIVFSDPANVGVVDANELPVLRVQSTFSGGDTFAASNGVAIITFNREGYAIGIPNGTLIALHDSTANSNWTRCLSVNLSGLLVSAKSGQIVNGATCN
jgi:type IV fimbrial biogenesis protein FimT